MDVAAVKKYISKLPERVGRTKLAVAAGLLIILLILVSEYVPSSEEGKGSAADGYDSSERAEMYSRRLEQKLEDMISSVEGAGRTKVMVTLKNGSEYVYASSGRTSVDTSQSTGSGGQQSSGSRENTENSFMIIEDKDGKHALVRTELAPTISGVVVVCEGASDPAVKARIEEVVTTALGVSPKRVCITLLSSQEDGK